MKKTLFIISALITLFIVFCLYNRNYSNSNFINNTDTVSTANYKVKNENKKKKFVFNTPIWDSLTMYKVHSVTYTKQVTFRYDEYGWYCYKTATKRHKFLCADITITSQQEIPIIPAFNVFYLKNHTFIPIQKDADMDTEYVYDDTSFRVTDNVRYKIFMEIPDSIINQYPVYIMATRTNVYELSTTLWGRLDPHWYAFNINTEFEHTPNLQIAYKMN